MTMLEGWIPPTIAFMVTLGAMGITVKLALEELDWRAIVVWSTIAYMLAAASFLVLGGVKLTASASGTTWAIVSGVGAAASFAFISMALSRGEASLVIPVSSAYPVITVLLALVLLGEVLTFGRIIGVILVVSGLIILGRFG